MSFDRSGNFGVNDVKMDRSVFGGKINCLKENWSLDFLALLSPEFALFLYKFTIRS